MTEEQEEAIEIIDKMIKSYIEADEYGLSNNDFKYEIKAMQTVLNMLKEKDKEINRKSSTINALQCALYERTEERDRKNNIIAKQNKMIDLMAEYLDEDDTSLANYLYRKNGKCNSEMVKQYFKSKAEKE